MSQLRGLLLVALAVLAVAGCGGEKKSESAGKAQAACTGAPLSAAPKLPSRFPMFESVTYTRQSTQGPTEIIEGYYEGDVEGAYDEVKPAFERAGYEILFDELEDRDAEVSWKAQGRSGQVAMREECGDADRTYVRITNRPQ